MESFIRARSLQSRSLFSKWRQTCITQSRTPSTFLGDDLTKSTALRALTRGSAAQESVTSPLSAAIRRGVKTIHKNGKRTYPLLPSVEHLVHQYNLDASVIEQITPTGPNDRLLKGDVLAYLGSISSKYPLELSVKLRKLSHLDLSHIKLVPQASTTESIAPTRLNVAEVVEDVEVTTNTSMAPAIEVQKRIQSTLGVIMPLSTFVARAADIANNNLPRAEPRHPSENEIFDQILGLANHRTPYYVKGRFSPEITVVQPPSQQTTTPKLANADDLFDILLSKSGHSSLISKEDRACLGASNTIYKVSVRVRKGDERRGNLFLERVKSLLEVDPGRLVL